MHRVIPCVVGLVLLLSSAGWESAARDVPLAWDAPTTHVDGSPALSEEINGYLLYVGTSSGQYAAPIDVGLVTQYLLVGLDDGTMYVVVVSAYNPLRVESPRSAPELTLMPPTTPAPRVPLVRRLGR